MKIRCAQTGCTAIGDIVLTATKWNLTEGWILTKQGGKTLAICPVHTPTDGSSLIQEGEPVVGPWSKPKKTR